MIIKLKTRRGFFLWDLLEFKKSLSRFWLLFYFVVPFCFLVTVYFLLTCVPGVVSLLSSSPVWCHLHTCLTSSWWSLPVSPPPPAPPSPPLVSLVCFLVIEFFSSLFVGSSVFAPVFPARLTCPPVTCPPPVSFVHSHLLIFVSLPQFQLRAVFVFMTE